MVLGIQYEIRSRNLSKHRPLCAGGGYRPGTISLLNDGAYAGAKITPSSVREYETTYAAHILGYLGSIDSRRRRRPWGEGYAWND